MKFFKWSAGAATSLVALLAISGISAESLMEPATGFVSKGDSLLSTGDVSGALEHYDSAVRIDPENYLYLFKRGAALLSLGRDLQALKDFDRALEIGPKFESALNQRAKINLKFGRIESALDDAKGLKAITAQNIIESAAIYSNSLQQALKAEKKGDIEGCIAHASEALAVSPNSLEMRKLRAKCRISHNDMREALVDLSHVQSLTPSNPESFVTAVKIYYYSFHEYDSAMQTLRRCLQYDPDCAACLKVHRQIKKIEKKISKYSKDSLAKKVAEHEVWKEVKTTLDQQNVYKDIEKDVLSNLKEVGTTGENSGLLRDLQQILCEAYYNTKDFKSKQGQEYCKIAFENDRTFATAVLYQASVEMDKDNFDIAAQILHDFQQSTGIQDHKVASKLREAQILARRAKEKDYYKVLGVSRTADDKEIKKAYRGLTKQFHPDKYRGQMTAEEVERKMADINEAYEVLSDEEKRQQFDNGHDPNDPNGGGPGGPGGNPFRGTPFHFQAGGPGGFHQQHFQGGFDFGSFQEQFMKQQFRAQSR
ncbi:Jem1p [Sugiyamaella lignohabitans]|uniref:Jem1p n=1 Tax=Sugiyamaella lignohabitans TaxID=796027 RepID=A0A167FXB0_9ASCO|nr:Jem1p [Sugiyamaella lignohabitans]ANB15822.1 Jem1p [Sugiyamaella lignohabitans]